jgi:hypothetical protein
MSPIISRRCRFEEVTELIAVCFLEIWGSINSGELSPNTKYAAYLVFMLADGSYGLDCPTQEAFIVIGDHDQIASVKRTISLHPLMMKDKPSVTGRGDEDEQGGRRPYEEESITASYP